MRSLADGGEARLEVKQAHAWGDSVVPVTVERIGLERSAALDRGAPS